MSDIPINNEGLDPYHKAQDSFEQEAANFYEAEEAEAIENEELKKQQIEEDRRRAPFGDKITYKVPILGQGLEAFENVSMGVGDFAFDAIGLVPWLKPIDNWWDNNSPRSKHPAHKMIRDASSVIIPSLVGGTAITGGLKGLTWAQKLPTITKTLGNVAAWAGVDTTVAMISSHSKTDDNLAGTLENWLGVDIPWATRDSDSPDVRWKKNVMESAGL